MRIIILLMCSFLLVDQSFGKSTAVSVVSENKYIRDPKSFVGMFIDETLKIINKPKNEQITTESLPIIDRYVDVEAIAKFSIGPSYRGLSTEKKGTLLKSFRNMLANRFSFTLKSALDKYKFVNVKFVVNDVKIVKKDRQYVVYSSLFVNSEEINIHWSVFIVSGALKILNMNVAGIDLGQVLRDEITAKIKELGIDGFLEDFKRKNEEL